MKPLSAQVSSFILPPSSLLAMRRPERVADILRDEISQIVGYELEDPRITMVTVTDVRLSENLKSARVYVTVAGNEEEHELALAALRKAAPYVRKQVGLSLNLPRTPEIHFVRDRVEEEGERVDKLLDKIERDWASQESKERIKDEFKG
ncbi:MAG: 30S ribosome-binding factor RbfA [Pyrinomonadaceae bacterium]|jgi:ribosome-binding factor A|nr:30S ribosome-binding factor RbfA [Pyrinomonadaceae bacterium]